jgi:hypothetical protein
MIGAWEEIHGFNSLGEFKRFCSYVEEQVSSGLAIERASDPNYAKGMIFGGRWFEYLETGEIWRLVSPDFPFRGLWEKVVQDFR